jgi:hypothetical protein
MGNGEKSSSELILELVRVTYERDLLARECAAWRKLPMPGGDDPPEDWRDVYAYFEGIRDARKATDAAGITLEGKA